MIREAFIKHSTFEAILLPKCNDEPKSWRYCQKSHMVHTKDYYFIIIVYFLRYRNELLIDKPFEVRSKYIDQIKGTNVISAETTSPGTPHDIWTMLYRKYKNSNSKRYPIDGIVLRHRKSTVSKAPYQYRFPKNLLFNIDTMSKYNVDGQCTLRLSLNNKFNFGVVENCTICIIYAHDDQYYYICFFDRGKFVFKHVAKSDRLTDLTRKKIHYRNDKIIVQDCKIIPNVVAFVRVYYNNNQNFSDRRLQSRYAIVGYEFKFITSMYDIPYSSVQWFDYI